MISLSDLHAELEKTACHLAGCNVRVIFERPHILRAMVQKVAKEQGRDVDRLDEMVTGGLCIAYPDSNSDIRLDISNTVEQLWRIFLHETAHALYNRHFWVFPAQETVEGVVNEQRDAWMSSIAWRYPNDINELVSWLEKLRTFGDEKHIFRPVRVVGDHRKYGRRMIRMTNTPN